MISHISSTRTYAGLAATLVLAASLAGCGSRQPTTVTTTRSVTTDTQTMAVPQTSTTTVQRTTTTP